MKKAYSVEIKEVVSLLAGLELSDEVLAEAVSVGDTLVETMESVEKGEVAAEEMMCAVQAANQLGQDLISIVSRILPPKEVEDILPGEDGFYDFQLPADGSLIECSVWDDLAMELQEEMRELHASILDSAVDLQNTSRSAEDTHRSRVIVTNAWEDLQDIYMECIAPGELRMFDPFKGAMATFRVEE